MTKISKDIEYEALKEEVYEANEIISELKEELELEKWRNIEFWEYFKKLKKFALHFKNDIKEGLSENYRKGENIVFDSLSNEFGNIFLRELLKEVLEDE